MLGLFGAVRTGIFAARISGCLTDLGIDVHKLNKQCKAVLFEIECKKAKEMSPQEAALYFLCGALPDIEPSCFLLPVGSRDIAQRAAVISDQWVSNGKMRQTVLDGILVSFRRQM